jgi:hypothetical protein
MRVFLGRVVRQPAGAVPATGAPHLLEARVGAAVGSRSRHPRRRVRSCMGSNDAIAPGR